MSAGDYIAASNLVLYVLGGGVIYALKIIFASIEKMRKQSVTDDDRLEGKLNKQAEKTDANESIRRGADLDQYRLISALQIRVAYMEGYKDGKLEGKTK